MRYEPFPSGISDDHSPLDAVADKEEHARVRKAIDRLDPTTRAWVAGSYGIGQPVTGFAAFATAYGVSEQTVRRGVSAGLARLSRWFRDCEVDAANRRRHRKSSAAPNRPFSH